MFDGPHRFDAARLARRGKFVNARSLGEWSGVGECKSKFHLVPSINGTVAPDHTELGLLAQDQTGHASQMKVRIGFGLGTRSDSGGQERFRSLVDGLEAHGFDSLWLSERINGTAPDPLMGMAYAVGRTTKLKVGMSVLVLPGRNPVVLAKAIASLDQLSGGRVLPAFGLGVANAAEHQAFGVERTDRGGWFNEALPLMRRLWTEDHVSHAGKRFTIDDVTVRPKPMQQPLDVWLGGISPLELRRVGRHGDGWLPSFCVPAQVAEARRTIEQIAKENDREIDAEHFGALIAYRRDGEPISDAYREIVATRLPGADPADVMPTKAELPLVIQRFIDVGFSKFVIIPANEPGDWDDELAEMASLTRPLEN
ncbi:MAG: LLM class flavin-dependent oxidoreductase [Acidimicrobiales bacterium]